MSNQIRTPEAPGDLLGVVQRTSHELRLEPVVVLLGGSRNEGFGNHASDFDVVVVHREHATTQIKTAWWERQKVEMILMSPVDYRRLLSGSERVSADGNDYYFLDARRRLFCSSPMLGHQVHYDALAVADRARFREEVLSYHSVLATKSFSDLRGCLGDNRPIDEALVRLRAFLERKVDCVLVSLDDLYFRPKWRLARVGRTLGGDEGVQHWAAWASESLSGRSLKSSATESDWLRRTAGLVLGLQYLITFPEWRQLLSSDVMIWMTRAAWDQPPLVDVNSNPDGTVRIQSLSTAVVVSAELGHAACASLLGFRGKEHEQLCTRFAQLRGAGELSGTETNWENAAQRVRKRLTV